jgi:hypothetical protein
MTAGNARHGILNTAIATWMIARVPLVLAIAYTLREPILAWVEDRFDIIFITLTAIDLLSTPLVRAMFVAGTAAALVTTYGMLRRRSANLAAAITIAFASAIFFAAAAWTETSLVVALIPTTIIAANLVLVPAMLGNDRRRETIFMVCGVGLAELLALARYCRFVSDRLGRAAWPAPFAVFALNGLTIVLATTVGTAALKGHAVVATEQALRMPAGAKKLLAGDFNWIDFDETRRWLYVTGHGVPRLRAYSIDEWTHPEVESSADTGAAQAFWFDRSANEILAFNLGSKRLLHLDSETLTKGKAREVPDLSPGDPWIVADARSGTIAIASEADISVGMPFVVLDRESGETLDTRNLEPGNLLLHPEKPLLYMSFFRRGNGILVYDLQRRAVTNEVRSDARLDRMAFWPSSNEVLVASPAESRVLRYDADTLEPKGYIDGPIGVRVLAVDRQRNLLVAGSLATGIVTVHELITGHQLDRHYLGPWLRSISLVEEGGLAYVSSNGALYSLQYVSVE